MAVQCISPKRSSAQRLAGGQVAPSLVRLSASTKSYSSPNDAISSKDGTLQIEDIDIILTDGNAGKPEATTLIRSIMFGLSIHLERALLVVLLLVASITDNLQLATSLINHNFLSQRYEYYVSREHLPREKDLEDGFDETSIDNYKEYRFRLQTSGELWYGWQNFYGGLVPQ